MNKYDEYWSIMDHLQKCYKQGVNFVTYEKQEGLRSRKLSDYNRRTIETNLRDNIITLEEYTEFKELFYLCKENATTNVTLNEGVDYDGRANGTIIRDDDNKILQYEYTVLIRDKEPLQGTLTRDEMNMIYNLYSSEGANLTQRSISRVFPHLSLRDFKRILRAFNITKDSIPLAPHILEEKDINVSVDEALRIKENEFFKRLEERKIKEQQKRNEELIIEVNLLKEQLNDINGWLKNINFTNIEPYTYNVQNDEINNKKALILYLSDWHVGCEVGKDSLYENNYDSFQLQNRLNKIYNQSISLFEQMGTFDEIILCNLGDSLDGYNNQTTRGGHALKQNMNNREQFNVYVNCVINFIENLHDANISERISYHCVADSNHDGDFGYIANKALEMYLNVRFPNMNVKIYDKFIGVFEYGKHTFLITHGKDSIDMQKGFPFTLNVATENKIHEFLDVYNIKNDNIHFIKGDLHRTNSEYSKRFRYKNVSSILGSSQWIHANFGLTKAAVDYDIVSYDNDTLLEGHIVLN